MSALTKYSVVTPKRPEATCLIAERFKSPLGSGLNLSGSSPPSPVLDLPPILFIATASVVCASREMEPNDIAPVAKRLTISAAVSTSSSSTALRPTSSAVLIRKRPRKFKRCSLCLLRTSAKARYCSCAFPRTACCKSDTVSGVQLCASPRKRNA